MLKGARQYPGHRERNRHRFDDRIIGNANQNYLAGGAGNDTISGGGGDDILVGGLGADALDGGSGTDTVSYADNYGAVFVDLRTGNGYGNAAQGDTYTSIENVIGSSFNDTLIGDENANRLEGGDGDDNLLGGLGADVMVGGLGSDAASYEDNWGAVFADLRTNQGYGNAAQGDTYIGIENLTGSIFNDTLIGNDGVNRLMGGDGDDVLIGGLGADRLIGGLGSDTASYIDNQGAVTVDLLLGRGFGNAAEGDILEGIENITGTSFNDTLIGDNGANRLAGGAGADTLVGNGGADEFVFDSSPSGGVDRILDFTSGQDKIVLESSWFDLPEGALGATSLVFGTQATGGSNRLIYDQSTGNLWFDSDGFGTDPAVLFAVLDNRPTITAADFTVI